MYWLPDAGTNGGQEEEKGTTGNEMIRWPHRLNGLEFEQTPGNGEGQGSLASCSPWGCKELDMTEQLNWTELFLWNKALISGQFNSVQLLSHVQLFATPWIAARQASLSITNSWSSLKLTSIKSAMPSSHLILCHPLFLLPPIPPSIRVLSNESTLRMRWIMRVFFAWGSDIGSDPPYSTCVLPAIVYSTRKS